MSTRCNIHVIQEGLSWNDTVQLYHHSDGYPSNMLRVFAKAFAMYGGDWHCGRTGHAAAFLCATEPQQFEPESHLELHGDIEFFYKLYVVNTKGGSMAEKPQWEVEVFRPDGTSISERRNVQDAISRAADIESRKYGEDDMERARR